jgi:hypothetical protein
MSGVRCFNGINGATGEYSLAPRSTSNDLRLSWTTDPIDKGHADAHDAGRLYGGL